MHYLNLEKNFEENSYGFFINNIYLLEESVQNLLHLYFQVIKELFNKIANFFL